MWCVCGVCVVAVWLCVLCVYVAAAALPYIKQPSQQFSQHKKHTRVTRGSTEHGSTPQPAAAQSSGHKEEGNHLPPRFPWSPGFPS